ncbi:unnamed protein product [Spirodela intermedia]|uniref:Zinc finger ZPR1-type domain-containing protein n=1 Tax=Spirodela intermedia TaxID=51605 RepID=A0A7I8KFT2_SPIIN|nr:unnamed protein product [Spirodela intermedia]
MDGGGGETIVEVGKAAETVSEEGETSSFLYATESLCMRCGENGTTRFLATRIPHFREVILMAFECPHCNERNNEVQFAGAIQPRGCLYSLKVPSGDVQILNRQVVKSDSASIKIPELEFEIPPEAQRGTLSTVEGVLLRASEELEALQEERKKVAPDTAEAINAFLKKLRSFAAGDASFTFVLNDPAGNSFIENPYAPSPDPSLSISFYERSREQQASLGFLSEPFQAGDSEINSGDASSVSPQREAHGSIGAVGNRRTIAQADSEEVAAALCRYTAPEEVLTMPSTCGACGVSCVTRFFATKIPYFREVIVMATTCDQCGYRSSELKPGGEIPAKGRRIILHVQNSADLSRDVIKSDNASVSVPELELDLTSGTLGGLVTTVEGLITKISENLQRVHGFTFGDSLDDGRRKKWLDFKERLAKLLNMEQPWTLIIDDALSSSFVSPATDAIEDDHQLIMEEYERTWEQNEELGLNDMDTSSADAAYSNPAEN